MVRCLMVAVVLVTAVPGASANPRRDADLELLACAITTYTPAPRYGGQRLTFGEAYLACKALQQGQPYVLPAAPIPDRLPAEYICDWNARRQMECHPSR